jgi:low affinity Fe/Cu permease
MSQKPLEPNNTTAAAKPSGEATEGNRETFRRCAHCIARGVGSPWCFFAAVLVIAGWGASGPIFHFSDTWQLVINTATTIITFLMVFLIQNTQNRDTRAIQLKLDELLRGVKGARTRLVNLEELSDSELDDLHREFQRLSAKKGKTEFKAVAE